MIYVEDQTIKLNGVVLPGLVKSIEVTESAKVDEQEVEGSATKPKQATGYEDAKVNIELIIDDTQSATKYQRYASLRSIFRKPGRAFRSLSPLSARTQQPTASRRSSSRSSPTRARARADSLPPPLSSGSISLRPSPRPRRAAAPRAPAILGAEAPPQAAASPKSMRPTCQRAVESLRQLMTPRQRQR